MRLDHANRLQPIAKRGIADLAAQPILNAFPLLFHLPH
jgi:hypothetical protein